MADTTRRRQGSSALEDPLDHAEDVRLDSGPAEAGILGLEQLDELVAEHLLEAGRGRVVHHSEVLFRSQRK